MLHSSERELLLATTLIAFGPCVFRFRIDDDWDVLGILGVPLVGAGLFIPVKHPWIC